MRSVVTLTATPLIDRAIAKTDEAPLPRLLVVTYYAPDTHHGGAVCLQRMLKEYPRDRLIWMHHDWPSADPASDGVTIEQWPIDLLRRPNRFGLHRIKEYGNWTFHAPRIARAVAERARAAGVEAVLGIGPGLSVWTSHLIAENLNLPLHLWIHDDPMTYADYRGCSWLMQRRVQRCFLQAYRAATVRYAISEPMRRHYRELTGCDAVLLPPSRNGRLYPPDNRKPGSHVRIGFCGSLSGVGVWTAFLRALYTMYRGQPTDQQPEIVTFADADGVPVPPEVEQLNWVRKNGWRPADEVNRELATMDYLYLPLWFDPGRRLHAATSFSTKFVGYLGLGVPILCHMPAYSAVAEYVRGRPVGAVLDTIDVNGLAGQLRRIFDAPETKRRHAECWSDAADDFDQQTLTHLFYDHLRRAK